MTSSVQKFSPISYAVSSVQSAKRAICQTVSELAIPAIQASSAYFVSRRVSEDPTEQALTLGGLLAFSSYLGYKNQLAPKEPLSEESDWKELGIDEKSVEKLKNLNLTKQESEHLLSLFTKWPSDNTIPISTLLGLDLFEDLHSQAEIEPRLKPLINRFVNSFRDHEVVLSAKSINRQKAIEYDQSPRERAGVRKFFSAELTRLETECPSLHSKIVFWQKLLKSDLYDVLIADEDQFRFIDKAEKRHDKEKFRTIVEFILACYLEVTIRATSFSFEAERSMRDWLKEFSRNNPTRFLKAIRKSMDQIKSNQLNRIFYSDRFGNRTGFRFRFHCQRLMNLYEDHVYGYSKKDHLVRILHNLTECLYSHKTRPAPFQKFYDKFNRSDFFSSAVQLLEQLDLCPIESKKMVIVRLYTRIFPNSYKTSYLRSELNAIHRKYTNDAKTLCGLELEQLKQEYREHALDFSQLYLLMTDIEKLQKDEFSKDPLQSLPDHFLDLLSLEADSLDDIQESEAFSELESDFEIEEKQEEPSDFPKIKEKRRGAPAPVSASAQAAPAPVLETVPEVSERPQIRIRNLKHRKLIQMMREHGFFRQAGRGHGSHQTYSSADGRQTTVAGHGGRSVYKMKTAKSMQVVLAKNS